MSYLATYGYASTTGRLTRVAGPGLPGGAGDSFGAFYAYLAASDRPASLKVQNAVEEVLTQTDWAYETDRDAIVSVANRWYPAGEDAMISFYSYANNRLGQRTLKGRQGLAFSGDFSERFGYNPRGELTASLWRPSADGCGAEDPNFSRSWAYDNAGNRETHAVGPNTPLAREHDYLSNALNQYVQDRVFVGGALTAGAFYEYDADGNLERSALVGDMNCDGAVDTRDIDALVLALTDSMAYAVAYPDCNILQADANGDGWVSAHDIDAFAALLSGDAGVTATPMEYAYDAENRLIAASPRWPSVGSLKVTFAYDYMGRRVAKRVFGYDDANDVWLTTPVLTRRFIYDGWRPVLELDGADAVVRKYTWGLDLSGSRDGVAGIGGLLAMEDPNDPNGANATAGEFVYAYDANGNVGQLVDWSSTLDPNEPDSVNAILPARYAYTPYGQLTSASGDYADENPMRFSTKYWDDATGLGYWGRRYYDGLRWITHDPIEERGGWNLFSYVANQPSLAFDAIGEYGAVMPGVAPGTPSDPYWPRPRPDLTRPSVPGAACHSTMAGVLALFHLNRARTPGAVMNDKFAHCYISCRLAQDCGSVASAVTGTLREAFQQFWDWDGSIDDMIANVDGIYWANKKCPTDKKQRCKRGCEKDHGSAQGMYLP